MPERFGEIEKAVVSQGNDVQSRMEEVRPSDWELLKRLGEYPELKTKIEKLLAIIENAGGDVEKANEAEKRIIEELRQMGNEVLHSWARRQRANQGWEDYWSSGQREAA